MTNTNAWKQPLLSDRRFRIGRAHRLSTANTDGQEGLTVADRQAQRELQHATEEQAAEQKQKRETLKRRKATDSLYSGTNWKKKPSRSDGRSDAPSKRSAARDRVAIAMRKIAKAGIGAAPAQSAGRSDSADSLVINGRMCMKDAEGVWVDVVTGEPCRE